MSSYHGLSLDERRWREDAEEREQAVARATRERRRSERRQVAETTAIAECAALRAELVALRDELEAKRRADFTTLCQTIAKELNDQLSELVRDVEKTNRALRTELEQSVEATFGRLEARIRDIDSQARRAEFKFAREKRDDVEELPAGFLPARRRMN